MDLFHGWHFKVDEKKKTGFKEADPEKKKVKKKEFY